MTTNYEKIRGRISDDATAEPGCWDAPGMPFANSGYGRVKVNYQSRLAHRVSYELAYGPIPEGLVIDHICRNRRCFRPSHLRAVTQQENTLAPGSLAVTKVLSEKTHCPQGHEYTEDNTWHEPVNGKFRRRQCRACMRARSRRKYQKRKQRELNDLQGGDKSLPGGA